jgi:AcrR family transcriptional regulator
MSAAGARSNPSAATRPDRRRARNRQALLRAAETLFAAKGVDRTTIDEIAETADLAKGTFYNYFEDKSSIAREVALAARSDLALEVGNAQRGVEDPAEQTAIGMCIFFHSAVAEPTHAAVVAQMFAHWLQPESAGNLRLRRNLEDGYRCGRFSGTDLAAAVVMTVGITQAGIARILQMTDRKGARALASKLCALELRALGLRWNQAQEVAAKAVARVFDEKTTRPAKEQLQ